jgi:short-subunit dehydrogenase
VTEAGINERMIEAAHERFDGFHAVFANAGYALVLPVIDESAEQTRRMFDVNFFACLDLCKASARHLREHGRTGHLVMCSSSVSRFALPEHGTYAATKAAQHQVCAAMRHELWDDGIYVSSVHPITTTTEFFEVAAEQSGRPRPIGGVPGHTPKFMLQSSETVAKAVVKCLKRPRPEVWTSTLVRTVAGVMTMSPRFYDFIMRRNVVPKEKAARGEE